MSECVSECVYECVSEHAPTNSESDGAVEEAETGVVLKAFLCIPHKNFRGKVPVGKNLSTFY